MLFRPWTSEDAGRAEEMKRALTAIAEGLPDLDHNYLTKVDISRGWGDILNVRLHTTLPHSEAWRGFGDQVRSALDETLADERHHVEIVSSARGQFRCDEVRPIGDLWP